MSGVRYCWIDLAVGVSSRTVLTAERVRLRRLTVVRECLIVEFIGLYLMIGIGRGVFA